MFSNFHVPSIQNKATDAVIEVCSSYFIVSLHTEQEYV